jgi:hypothetical protein
VTIGTDDLRKEEFARTLQRTLQGDGRILSAWAPAADVNLTSNEQGELAGPFIGTAIAVVLLIVGIAFRSYWAVAVCGAALAMLMVWLRDWANLIGLENDQILSTILPISMISFGIDSAFHGVGRVREEGKRGSSHGRLSSSDWEQSSVPLPWPRRQTQPRFSPTPRQASNRSFSSELRQP